jgi:hypothetical protein
MNPPLLPAADHPHAIPTKTGDRMGFSAAIAAGALVLSIVGCGAVGVHMAATAYGDWPAVLSLQEAAGLSTPAWSPSGSPLRMPSGMIPAVDLRYVPGLPAVAPSLTDPTSALVAREPDR